MYYIWYENERGFDDGKSEIHYIQSIRVSINILSVAVNYLKYKKMFHE